MITSQARFGLAAIEEQEAEYSEFLLR